VRLERVGRFGNAWQVAEAGVGGFRSTESLKLT
jgi:hypothetical protein